MREPLDLDAYTAARADEEKTPLPIRLGGEIFHAIRPLRVSVAVAAAEGNVGEAVRGLFGAQAKAVLDAGLDLEQLRMVVEDLLASSEVVDPGNVGAASSG